jgi:AAA domain, putative AbiEii toxin, Type IV TA system
VVPTDSDVKDISAVRRDLESLPQILKLTSRDVRARVLPFLDTLEAYASAIPRDIDVAKLMKQDTSNSEVLSALLAWSSNQSRRKKFKPVSDIVSKYNTQKTDLFFQTDRYSQLMNGFLANGGKTIEFNERGYMFVAIRDLKGERSIASLSSGEAQIFVILTHLAFNLLAQNNVLIIDEPELSLHVQWQELFVDSILSSNPNIQYVLATHSPSIILERVKFRVDISKKPKRTAKPASKP